MELRRYLITIVNRGSARTMTQNGIMESWSGARASVARFRESANCCGELLRIKSDRGHGSISGSYYELHRTEDMGASVRVNANSFGFVTNSL